MITIAAIALFIVGLATGLIVGYVNGVVDERNKNYDESLYYLVDKYLDD